MLPMMFTPLPESFYLGDTVSVAKRLLGKELVRRIDGHLLRGRIVEVEAYRQFNDPAAHSFNGQTDRNAVMFGPAGMVYVYLSYGIHFCMNVVTEDPGLGCAVLIRAVEPLEGLAYMAQARPKARKPVDYANGPGKLCQAFGVNLNHNGISLQNETFFLAEPRMPVVGTVVAGPRVGITKAVDLPWRFYFAQNAFVSKAKGGSKTQLGAT